MKCQMQECRFKILSAGMEVCKLNCMSNAVVYAELNVIECRNVKIRIECRMQNVETEFSVKCRYVECRNRTQCQRQGHKQEH